MRLVGASEVYTFNSEEGSAFCDFCTASCRLPTEDVTVTGSGYQQALIVGHLVGWSGGVASGDLLMAISKSIPNAVFVYLAKRPLSACSVAVIAGWARLVACVGPKPFLFVTRWRSMASILVPIYFVTQLLTLVVIYNRPRPLLWGGLRVLLPPPSRLRGPRRLGAAPQPPPSSATLTASAWQRWRAGRRMPIWHR